MYTVSAPQPSSSYKADTTQTSTSNTLVKFLATLHTLMKFDGGLEGECGQVYISSGTEDGMREAFHVEKKALSLASTSLLQILRVTLNAN